MKSKPSYIHNTCIITLTATNLKINHSISTVPINRIQAEVAVEVLSIKSCNWQSISIARLNITFSAL